MSRTTFRPSVSTPAERAARVASFIPSGDLTRDSSPAQARQIGNWLAIVGSPYVIACTLAYVTGERKQALPDQDRIPALIEDITLYVSAGLNYGQAHALIGRLAALPNVDAPAPAPKRVKAPAPVKVTRKAPAPVRPVKASAIVRPSVRPNAAALAALAPAPVPAPVKRARPASAPLATDATLATLPAPVLPRVPANGRKASPVITRDAASGAVLPTVKRRTTTVKRDAATDALISLRTVAGTDASTVLAALAAVRGI